MDKPSHPNVIRTWAVDRIRAHQPAPQATRPARKDKGGTKPGPRGPQRKMP